MLRQVPLFLLATALGSPAVAAAADGGATETTVDTNADADAVDAAAPANEAEPTQTAMEAFKHAHERVLLFLRSKVKDSTIQAEVDKLLNYPWIAHTALGGKNRAEKKCEPRCAEYAMSHRLINRSPDLKRLRDADMGTGYYVKEEKRPRASKVTTIVKFNKDGVDQQVEVAYVMRFEDGRWQVVDIITDGVSLAKNYRYEIGQILHKEGIDGVITRLRTKLADLAKAQ